MLDDQEDVELHNNVTPSNASSVSENNHKRGRNNNPPHFDVPGLDDEIILIP
jgi:hypothetical protein